MDIQQQQLPKTSYRKPSYTVRDAAVRAAKGKPPEESWIRYPGQEKWARGSDRVTAARINGGDRWGPGFEAAVRNGVLFVRHVG